MEREEKLQVLSSPSLAKTRYLQLRCARVLHVVLLMPVPLYGSKRMLYRENERSWIRAVQMDNLKGLLGIGEVDKVRNARIRELFGVSKGEDKRIVEYVFGSFGHV